jgi:hypothetical protein
VYNVPENRILHVHGKVGRDIIFGHGRSLSSNSPESDAPWFHETSKEVAQIPGLFHKPVAEILERNRSILEGYGDVKNIIVIGHSVNEIDIPYFQCILNAYPDADWQNYNYENDDEGIDKVSETHDKLLALGVSETRLESFSSENLKDIYPVP